MNDAHTQRFQTLVDRITYRDWLFRCQFSAGRHYLQIVFHDGHGVPQYCRKWLLSPSMTDGEVVQTALKAVLAAEEHEARERFLVDGERVFSPHLNLNELIDFMRERRAIEGREAAQFEIG